MAFDTTGLDEACLDIGDDFTYGASTFQMVPSFTEQTENSDGFEIRIGERLQAQTTIAVIAEVELDTRVEITHDRTGNSFVVLGFLADAENWVTVELERVE